MIELVTELPGQVANELRAVVSAGFAALLFLHDALADLPVSLDHDEIRCRIGFAASLLKDGADIVEKTACGRLTEADETEPFDATDFLATITKSFQGVSPTLEFPAIRVAARLCSSESRLKAVRNFRSGAFTGAEIET